MSKRDVKQVILVRTDLKNRHGHKPKSAKMMAQVGHAAGMWLIDRALAGYEEMPGSEVRRWVRAHGDGLVICTYQSADLLDGLRFALGVFDEAHKTAGGGAFGFALDDDNVRIDRRLFLTATPRHAKASADGTEDVYSMDDERRYGPVVYRLSFRQAVAAGLIVDCRVLVISVPQSAGVEASDAAVSVALAKAMEKYGASRAITFHRSVAQAAAFAEEPALGDVERFHVSGAMPTSRRATAMGGFRSASGKAIMTNARCLTEGVDVPAVDMVGFVDPKSSMIDIVQAAGRAMRTSPGKEMGYIFLPVFVPAGVTDASAIKDSVFATVFEVLQAMREQDEVLAAAIKARAAARKAEGGEGEKEGAWELPGVVFDGFDAPSIEVLRRAIDVRVVGRLGGLSVDEKDARTLRWIDDRGRRMPKRDAKDPEEARHGRRLDIAIRFRPESDFVKELFKRGYKLRVDRTAEEDSKTLKWIDDRGRRMPKCDAKDPEEARHGRRISNAFQRRPESNFVKELFKRGHKPRADRTAEEDSKTLKWIDDHGRRMPKCDAKDPEEARHGRRIKRAFQRRPESNFVREINKRRDAFARAETTKQAA